MLGDLEVEDLGDVGDDTFGEAEPEREVGEVARRRHHHGIGRTVIDDRDGRLLGEIPPRGRHHAVAPRADSNRPVGCMAAHSAATPAVALTFTGTDFAAGTLLTCACWASGIRALHSG